MTKFIIFAIVFFILLWILLGKFTELRTTEKIQVFLTIFVVLAFGMIYTKMQDNKLRHDQQIINSFEQNNSIYCNGFEVNKSHFNFVTGTLTFVGKSANKKGILYSIDDCFLEKR